MRFLKQIWVGGALLGILGAVPASANTATFAFTVASLESVIGGITGFDGGLCNNTLDNCGIYKIIATPTNAPSGSTVTGGAIVGTDSNSLTPSAWTFATGPTTSGTLGDGASSGVTFISRNTGITSANTYSSINGGQTGNGTFNNSTVLDFVLTDTTGAYTAPVSFTFTIFLQGFVSGTSGVADSSKTSNTTVTMSISPTPEPSTWLLLAGTFPAILWAGRRSRRRN